MGAQLRTCLSIGSEVNISQRSPSTVSVQNTSKRQRRDTVAHRIA